MNDLLTGEDFDVRAEHSLGTWARIYVHGVIALIVFSAIAYLSSQLIPLFDFTGNRMAAIVVSLIVIVAGPPIAGSILLYMVFPLIGRKQAWRGLLSWDDRLIAELSNARSKAQIVLINWPSSEVRTMGVLTSYLETANSKGRMAVVYVPTAPQTRLGYIRVVAEEDVEATDWTLKQWQMYQLTFGASCPERLSQSAQ
ncbi:MAG: hypothetical protein AAGI63_14955 [Planctomycetota bacterium]